MSKDKKKVVKEAGSSPVPASAPKGHGPGNKTWGSNPGKVANKYPPKWGQKGMKSNSNSGGNE